MIESRTERLNLIYGKLKARGVVGSKGEFASLVGVSRTAMSSAMNGNEVYLTDAMFNKMIVSIPELSREFVFEGVGEILTEDVKAAGNESEMIPFSVDIDKMMDALKHQQILTEQAQRQVEKSQEQIDRLLDIIQNMQK